ARAGLPPPDRTGAAGMIFAVVRTHFARLRRDRAAFVLAFVVPIVFFSIFAGIFGTSRGGGTRKVALALVDEDGSENSRHFASALRKEQGLSVVTGRIPEGKSVEPPFNRASAEAAVRSGTLPVALILPKGFGETPISFGPFGRRPKVELFADTADPVAPQVVSGLLQGVAAGTMPGAPKGGAAAAGLVEVQVKDVLGETKKNPTSALLAAGL